MKPAIRAWQRMLSGRRLDLLDPSPLDIEIEDIAHGLARVARWNGQTIGRQPYSVAQHSLLVTMIFRQLNPNTSAEWQLMALLHDAPEYVIGDLISPFKAVVGGNYKQIEARLQRAVHLRFSLPAELPQRLRDTIKRADRIVAYFEAVELAGFSAKEAGQIFGRPRQLPTLPAELAPLTTQQAQRNFLWEFNRLERMRGNEG